MASPILDQYRKIAPGTEEFSDEALAEELRKNFYPDSDPEQFKANVGVTRDITQRPIDRYRAQVPQTWGMSDQELVSNLHAKFGGNRPVDEYARDFGVEFNSEPARPEQMTPLVNEPNNPEGRRFSAEERPEGEGFSAVTDTVGSLFGETQPTPSGQTDAARTDARTPEPTDSPARSQSRRNARPDNAQPIAEEPAETRRDDANISELPGEVSQFETRRSRRQNRPDALTFSDITDAVGDAAEGVNLRGTNVGFQAGTQQLAGAIAEGTGVTAQRYSNVRDAIDIDLATYNIAATEAAYENSLSEAETEQEKQEVAREYENRLANLRSDLNSSLESWQSQEPGAVASFMRDLGETMQGYAQETMQDEDFQRMSPIAQDISSGAGSIVPFLSLSLVGNVATRGAGPTAKIIGRYLPALTAASAQGVSEQYQRAIRAGLSEEEAIGKAIQGAPAGALQIAPIASLLKPLPAELRGKAIGQIVTIARTGGSEAVAEGGGVTLQNLIEKSYNPERGTWDNTAYNAAIGGLVGSGTQAAVQLATGGDGVNASAQDDVLDGIDVPSPDSGTPNTPIAIEDQQASERAQEPGANDALSFAVTNPEVDSPDPASAEPDPNQTADSAAAEQPTEETSAPVTDNLPQQAPDQVPDAVLDTAAPAADLPDVQTTLANINQRIQERAQELRSAGVPGDQIQSDQTIVSLSQQAQSLANVDRQTRSQQAEQNANNTIDSARAPVNDALGLQVESIREEADIRSPLRDEIQRLRARSSRPSVLPEVSAIDPAQAPETTERPSRREPTPLIPDATVTPTVRSNGRPFATEASLRRSAPFRNAVNPEIVPVEDGFGFIDRSQPDSLDPTPATTQTPTLSAVDNQTEPGSVEAFPTVSTDISQPSDSTGQNVEPINASSQSAIRDGSPVGDQNNVTQMRNPRDEARYNRNQIIRETAFQMERLVDLESQDSPFNRARIAEVRSTIDDLVSQRDAIDRQFPELATAEQERAQQNQGLDEPDSFTEGVNQALEGAVDDFFVEDLEIRIEESGEQAVEEAVDQLEEVATFGLAETMDGYQPNDFERQIIRRRARQSVNRALGRDQDAAFSRSDEPAGGLGLNEAMSYVDGLMGEWQNAPEVVVAQSESDLPASLQGSIERAKAQGKIRGVIVPGRIYVVADNNSSRAEVEETLFHEVIRHWGMREVLGENYDDFMDQVYIKVGRSAIEPFAKDNGLNLDADDSAERARNRRRAAEELLAHTTEEELGSRLFTRLVNLITDWLRRMGFRIQMTAYEIRDLLQRAKMYVEDGEFVTGTSVVEKHELYRGADHSQETEDAAFARNLDPADAINRRGPVKTPSGKTYVGVLPQYTIRNSQRTAPTKSLILSKTKALNADAQSEALDVLKEKHPDPLSSQRAWVAYANDAFGLDRLPMPPFRTLDLVANGPSAIVEELSQLSDGMRRDAESGLETASQFKRIYESGNATPDITARAFLWSFLSRGISPYIQESAFLDAIMSDQLASIMQRSQRDGWNEDLDAEYSQWAKSALPEGSPGRPAQQNVNAFGRQFLRVMSIRHPDADNKTGLEIIHQMIADGEPSGQIRREFLKRGSGSGIDNKVVSFTLLLLGRNDVLVLDRVQVRNQFNDGRFDGQNIYDIKKDENGEQISGSGFAEMTFGHKGLLYYEAMERALKPIVEQAYRDMGMQGSLGRYHWDSWLSDSNQEVGHASTEGLLREAQGQPNPYVGAFVRQGKYNNYDYGFRYAVLADNTIGTVVDKLAGDGAVILPLEVTSDSKSETRRVLSRLSTKAKKRDTDAGIVKPWTAALTAEERAEYDRAIESGGTPAPNLWANDPNAIGRTDRPPVAGSSAELDLRFSERERSVGPTGFERGTGGTDSATRGVGQEESAEDFRRAAEANKRADVTQGQSLDGDGRGFTDFFRAVTNGADATYQPVSPYKPAIPLTPRVQSFNEARERYRGNFDDHIATSIPGFDEVQSIVGQAIVDTFDSGNAKVLDIGTSEGALIKAISEAADGRISTLGIDPNPAMEKSFARLPQSEGANFSLAAFGSAQEAGTNAWTEDDGTAIPYFDPQGQRFDVVHEAMVFQFISNARNAQVSRVKELMKPSGIAIFEQKFGDIATRFDAAEDQKDFEWKSEFYTQEQIEAKRRDVLQRGGDDIEGMNKLTVAHWEMEEVLTNNFAHVAQFWEAGNFRGYVASDNPAVLESFLGNMQDTDTRFARNEMPREVESSDDVAFMRKDEDPNLVEARRRAGLGGRRRPIADFIQNLQALVHAHARDRGREFGHALAQNALDRFHSIKRIEQQTVGNLPAEQSSYVATRLSTGIPSTMRAVLHYGAPQWRDGVISKIDGSEGLLEILKPVQGDLDTFLGWVVAKRASRLYEEGRENLLEPVHIEALLRAAEESRTFDQFESVAEELEAFNKALLDVSEEAGLIDPNGRAAWAMSYYIPFYRMVDEQPGAAGPSTKRGLSGQSSGIRTLRGGINILNDPLENLIMNYTHLMDASMKNHALLLLVKNVDGYEGILEEVGPDFKQETIPMEQVRQRIIDSGGDPSLVPEDSLKGLAKMYAMKPPADDDVIRVMDGGKARYFKVLDRPLLKSLTAIHDTRMDFIGLSAMRWTKRVLTRGVTSTPEFIARNFIRDMMHAWTINEDKYRLGVDSLRGAAKTLKETGGTVDLMFAGGSFLGGYVNATDPNEVARATRQALRQKGYRAASARKFLSTIVDTPLKFWDMYTRVGDAIENSSREATYQAARKAGKSRAQSIFEAKDLMDYSMLGSNRLVQFFADVVPFVNAHAQGNYKVGRSGVTNPKKVFTRGALIMLATLALWKDNEDDERYQQLPDWDKDTYWHIFPPKMFGTSLPHIRIPKPFEIGVLFATIPERIAQNIVNNEGSDKTFERLLFALTETFSFNPVPQAFRPAYELSKNEDAFREIPIENMADRGKLPEARYSASTSPTAREIGQFTGENFGISPKQVEFLIRGYLGTLGSYALDITDIAVRSWQDDPKQPTKRIDQIPVVRSFFRAEPAMSTQMQSDFYELYADAREIQRTINAYEKDGDIGKAVELYEESKRLVAILPDLKRTASDLSDIRSEITAIYESEQMTPEEKRDAIDELISLRNEITRSQLPVFKEFMESDPLKE